MARLDRPAPPSIRIYRSAYVQRHRPWLNVSSLGTVQCASRCGVSPGCLLRARISPQHHCLTFHRRGNGRAVMDLKSSERPRQLGRRKRSADVHRLGVRQSEVHRAINRGRFFLLMDSEKGTIELMAECSRCAKFTIRPLELACGERYVACSMCETVMPLLPEVLLTLRRYAADAQAALQRVGRCIVAVRTPRS